MQELGIKFKTESIRVKYWIANYKVYIKIGLFVLFIITFSFGYRLIGSLFADADLNSIGVYGALFGALIGGGMSLSGSIWVSNRQLKSRAEIKRNEKIYTPLYDELIQMNNSLFEFNKYPPSIIISDTYRKDTTLPTYKEWIKIKNSTHYLEIPEVLKIKMVELTEIICDYNEASKEALKEIDNIWKSIMKDSKFSYDSNQVYYVLQKYLAGEKINFLDDCIYCPEISEKIQREEIQIQIEDAFRDSTKFSVVKTNYIVLESFQLEIIKMLEYIIKTTIKKYEK